MTQATRCGVRRLMHHPDLPSINVSLCAEPGRL